MDKKSSYASPNNLAALAANLAKGDYDIIGEIYTITYQKLFYFGLQIAGYHEQNLVEGVIQDFFIWLAKNYQQIGTIENFEAYLYQSIRRNIKQQLQAQSEKRVAQRRYQIRTAPNREKTFDSPEASLIRKEQLEADKLLLDKELQELPTYQKEVLFLRFYENRSYKDIAEILSVNAQIARNYVFRALTVLRKNMNKLPFF